MPHVAVVGGGILGAVLALRLRRQGYRVTLLEAGPSIGGLASKERFGEYTWDRFYHVVLLSDSHTRALIEELGLSDHLRWGITRTGFYTDGRLHSMSNALEFLRFPPLGIIDKLRLGATIFFGSRIRRPEKLEKVLATEWLARWSGRRVVDRIWLPLLKSKLGDNYRIASAAFIWAIIARMYAARRSGLKQELFGYLKDGYAPVLEALQAKLRQEGVDIRFDFPVESIRRDADFAVRSAAGATIRADSVVSTMSPALTCKAVPGLTTQERERLSRVTYQGVVCATVLTRKPLSRFYVTNITDKWVPFTGVIEMTALVDRSIFGGNSLIYLPLYLPQDDPRWGKSDDSLQEQFLGALERMYPHFDRADVLAFKVSRARQVLAISTLDYTASLMPSLETSIPGLYLVNSAQIAYGTLNVNETLGLVEKNISRLDAAIRSLQAPGAMAAPEGLAAMSGQIGREMPSPT